MMKQPIFRFAWAAMIAWACASPLYSADWTQSTDEDGVTLMSLDFKLYPAAEPQPALQYQFIPDDFERREGNAAIYYLRAMGFLEQNSSRDQLAKVWRTSADEANAKGLGFQDVPPFSWTSTPPDQLPLEEVKQYLQLTSFQPRDLKVAKYLTKFELDRNVKGVNSFVSILLPEVQTMRELARNQSIRCRVAIAENRVADAFEILGQQFAMANHLSQEPFLVSNLVGAAVAGIAWDDALYLAQLPDAPNMYWAYAALPNPLVNVNKSLAFERQILFLEIKELAEVDERPRPPGYWSNFVDRVLPKYASLIYDFQIDFDNPTEMDRFALVSTIAAAYPGAKRYLIKDLGMDPVKVENYPTAQVVFLAQKIFYERIRDDYFKWFLVNDINMPSLDQRNQVEKQMTAQASALGWAGYPATQLLPAVFAVGEAVKRTQLKLVLGQSIEAIRMYAAVNDGKLPTDLSSLPYPVPNDPFTGKPVNYQLSGDTATLTGGSSMLKFELNLRLAK